MKAISIWQPWASLTAYGFKKFETRGWRPPRQVIGQQIAICAAQDLRGFDLITPEIADLVQVACGCAPRALPLGRVVAVARLFDTFPAELLTHPQNPARIGNQERLLGDYAPGRFGWNWGTVRRLENPVRCRGQQNIFNLDPATAAEVIDQLTNDPN